MSEYDNWPLTQEAHTELLAGPDSYSPPDPHRRHALAAALGETPETVISLHLLRQGTCKAYVAGDPTRFDGVIIQPDDLPTEPVGFGADPNILWDLLQAVAGWDCVLVDPVCAPLVGGIIEQEMGVHVSYLDDVCHVPGQALTQFHNPAVRQLTSTDLELLESAPPELRASCWDSLPALLSEGVVACAIVTGEVVATALTAAHCERYADLGVFTLPDFRGRGFATAAASIVAQRVQQTGRTPVWGAGEHNIASLEVARKLGFVEVSRRTYVATVPYELQTNP